MFEKYKKYLPIVILAVITVTALLVLHFENSKPVKPEIKLGGFYGGYANAQTVGITSGAVAPGSNYVASIKVSNKENPIASSTYTVNNKTYNSRINIPIEELYGQQLLGKWVRIWIPTDFLVDNNYINSTSTGANVEFTGNNGTQSLQYILDTKTFNSATTTYWVKMDLFSHQATSTYMYFSNIGYATSSNYSDISSSTVPVPVNTWTSGSPITIFWENNNSSSGAYRMAGSYDTNPSTAEQLTVEYTYGGTQATTTIRVAANTDDIYYYTATYEGAVCKTNTTYSQFIAGNGGNGFIGRSGARFLNETIPLGATINRSWLTMVASSTQSATVVKTVFHGEATSSSATFSTCADFLARPRTTASTTWENIGTWTVNNTYTSPDISSSIQEIINATTGTTTPTPVISNSSTLYQPLVRVPHLFSADIYLDNGSQDWPYDIDFTASDGKTPLYYSMEKETELSYGQDYITFDLKITDTLLANDTYTIYLYYGKDTEQVHSAYYNADQVYTLNELFNATSTNSWNMATGTWSISKQEDPIWKGDSFRWERNPVWAKKNGIYYLLYLKSNSFVNSWRHPWYTSLATSTDLQHWTIYGEVFKDYSPWYMTLSANNDVGEYFGNLATSTDGTYYAPYTAMDNTVEATDAGIASSSDLIHWNTCASNPVYVNAGSGYTYTYDYSLAFDGSNTWYLYFVCYSSSSWGMCYATHTGANPCGAFSGGGKTTAFGAYTENFDIKKFNNLWYAFYSYNYVVPQTIGVGKSSNLTTWANMGLLTKDKPVSEGALQGTGKLWWPENGVYTMLYTAAPKSYLGYNVGGTLDSGQIDNFFNAATSSDVSSTSSWSGMFPNNMLKQGDDTKDLIARATTSVTYGDVSIISDMMNEWSNNNQQIGITWREQSGNNYYAANFVPGNGTYNGDIQVWKVTGGAWTILASTTLNFKFNAGGMIHRIRVQTYEGRDVVSYSGNGEDWTIAYNGIDSDIANTGLVGVFTKGIIGYFSNLTIQPFVYPDLTFVGTVIPPPPYVVNVFKQNVILKSNIIIKSIQ